MTTCRGSTLIMHLAQLTVTGDKTGGPILGISKSLTGTECKNWERGRAVSFLGIFVSTFRYSVAGEVGKRHDLNCDRSSKRTCHHTGRGCSAILSAPAAK
jgi:hypothetical protein